MGRAVSEIYSYLKRGVDVVLPPRCVLSGEPVDVQGMVSPQAWGMLNFIAPPFCACCGVPFAYSMADGSLCTACLEDKPLFETARSVFVYDDVSRKMILGFKHGDKTFAVRAFVPWMSRAGAQMLAQADLLVPVPLHPSRLLRRRYNQAALMAQALACEADLCCIPDALVRVRATVSQGHMGGADRFRNVKGAFSVHSGRARDVVGKKIVLVDDVLTSGATVSECTRALLKGGAISVHVLTLARVVRGESL